MASLSIVRKVLWMIWTERVPSPSAAIRKQRSHVCGSERAEVHAAERRKDMQTQRVAVARECRGTRGPDDVLEPVFCEAFESPRLHGKGEARLSLRDQDRQLVSDVLSGLAVNRAADLPYDDPVLGSNPRRRNTPFGFASLTLTDDGVA
jgi:hypothetical protein